MIENLEVAAALSGPVRAADVRISRRAIEGLVGQGILERPVHGVLGPPGCAATLTGRAAALALVLPDGAVLCRRTAAWLLGFDARRPGEHLDDPPLECVVPRGREPVARPGVRGYVAELASDDVTEVAGLPCTTPSRTAIDLARWAWPGTGLAVLDAMARAELIDPDELAFQLERWRGQRFVAHARRLVTWCDPLAESAGESWLRLRFLDAGFPRPELQIPLADGDGVLRYRIDLGYEELRAGWEYDGEEFHLGPEREEADRRRRADLAHRWEWSVIGLGKNLVLGPSMALEYGVGEVLGMQPALRRRTW